MLSSNRSDLKARPDVPDFLIMSDVVISGTWRGRAIWERIRNLGTPPSRMVLGRGLQHNANVCPAHKLNGISRHF